MRRMSPWEVPAGLVRNGATQSRGVHAAGFPVTLSPSVWWCWEMLQQKKINIVLVPCAPSLLLCTPGVKGKGATRPRVAPPARHRGTQGRRLRGGGPAPAARGCAKRGCLRAAACPPLSNAASASGKCHTQPGGRFPPLSPRPFPAASAHAASQPCLRTPSAPCSQGDTGPGAAHGAGGGFWAPHPRCDPSPSPHQPWGYPALPRIPPGASLAEAAPDAAPPVTMATPILAGLPWLPGPGALGPQGLPRHRDAPQGLGPPG